MTDTVRPAVRRGTGVGATPLAPGPATGVLAAAATLLTALVMLQWGPLEAVDGAVVQEANAALAPRPWLVDDVVAVTTLGGSDMVRTLTGIAVVAALLARRYRAAAYVLACWLLAFVVENGLKHVIGRPRPVLPVELVSASGGSFPSGHTMATTVLWVSLAVLVAGAVERRWWRWSVGAVVAVVVVAVATSRVLLGVHHPSDVVGAVLLGTLLALLLAPAVPVRRPG